MRLAWVEPRTKCGLQRSTDDARSDASFGQRPQSQCLTLGMILLHCITFTGASTTKSTGSGTWWRPRRSRSQHFAVLQRRLARSANWTYNRLGSLAFLCWYCCFAAHYWKVPFLKSWMKGVDGLFLMDGCRGRRNQITRV